MTLTDIEDSKKALKNNENEMKINMLLVKVAVYEGSFILRRANTYRKRNK